MYITKNTDYDDRQGPVAVSADLYAEMHGMDEEYKKKEKQISYNEVSCDPNVLAQIIDPAGDPYTYCEEKERRMHIQKIVDQLPPIPRRRAKMVMEGLTWTEIGEREGCSPTAARNSLVRKRNMFKAFKRK